MVRVADPAANAEAHLDQLQAAYEQGAHYAVCPELGLSSYTCGDLFFQDTLLEGVLDALAQVADATKSWNLAVSLGAPLRVGDAVFNCAVTIHGGRVLGVTPKAYPPNFREFYELRWFQPASAALVCGHGPVISATRTSSTSRRASSRPCRPSTKSRPSTACAWNGRRCTSSGLVEA